MKMAQEMMKNMSPEQIKALTEQAKESQGMLAEQVRKILEEEIQRRGLVTKEEVQRMLHEHH